MHSASAHTTVTTDKHLVSYHRDYDGDETTKLFVSRRGNWDHVVRIVDGMEFDTMKDAKQYAYERGWLQRYIPASNPLDSDDSSTVLWP
jgi:hypothetical protein